MEFVEGEVLSDKLKQQPEGRFEWPDLEPYILNLCDALEYAHERGMVHRDTRWLSLQAAFESIPE
jgi:serine/threonine protein kinase